MTSVIHKYLLRPGPNEIILPMSAEVRHFAEDPKNHMLSIWVERPAQSGVSKLAKFLVVMTGEEFDQDLWQFHSTAVTHDGWVAHLLTERPDPISQFNPKEIISYANQ